MYQVKEIGRVAVPVMISLLMEHIIGMTDTAFLGRLGETELGASALATILFMALFMLGFGFCTGSQIQIARHNGEENYREIGPVFHSSCVFLLALAAGLFVISTFLMPPVLRYFITSEAVFTATTDYLYWRLYGLFFAFPAALYRAFFIGTTNTRILTINSLVMVLTNVVLNYALIFGKFGFPAIGIGGAAIASSISEGVSLLFFYLYTRIRVDRVRYALDHWLNWNWKLMREVFNVSVWTMLQSFIAVSVWFVFFIAVEHLGEQTLAVVNLIRTIAVIPFLLLNSFAVTGSSLVSNLIGAGHRNEVERLVWKICAVAAGVTVPVLLLFLLFPNLLLRIYTDDPALIQATASALWIMALASFIQIFGFIWFNAVSGTGNTRLALIIECITLAIYLLTVYLVVMRGNATAAQCWTTEIYYQITALLLSYFLFPRKESKQRKAG